MCLEFVRAIVFDFASTEWNMKVSSIAFIGERLCWWNTPRVRSIRMGGDIGSFTCHYSS